MKALVLHAVNDIRLKDVKEPVLCKGQALVKVHACGICGSDIPRIYVNGTYHFPTIPGHEFAGEVVEIYSDSDRDREYLNKRVGIFPLIPCMECTQCRMGHYEMCSNYDYLGSRCDGGFAEYVKVPTWNLIKLPDNVSYEDAAMLEPMSVAVHSIRKAIGAADTTLDKSAKIAVIGLGTIGLLITMFLRNMGYENVYAIGNKDFQKETVIKLGIKKEKYLDFRSVVDILEANGNTSKEKLNKSQPFLGGFDLVFEAVGKNDTINLAIRLSAPLAAVCLVGNPASDISFDKNVYWMILRKQLLVTGTWNSSFTHEEDDDWNYVINQLADAKIHPKELITHRFPLDKLCEGLDIMHYKKENYIKVMGIFDED